MVQAALNESSATFPSAAMVTAIRAACAGIPISLTTAVRSGLADLCARALVEPLDADLVRAAVERG